MDKQKEVCLHARGFVKPVESTFCIFDCCDEAKRLGINLTCDLSEGTPGTNCQLLLNTMLVMLRVPLTSAIALSVGMTAWKSVTPELELVVAPAGYSLYATTPFSLASCTSSGDVLLVK